MQVWHGFAQKVMYNFGQFLVGCKKFGGFRMVSDGLLFQQLPTENKMSRLYFNEESDYSEENKCDNEVHHRKNIHASAADLLHTLLEQEIATGANEDIAKSKRKKQIVFIVDWWMQYLLLRLKSQSAKEVCRHPAFMGICPTISYTCQFYLPRR